LVGGRPVLWLRRFRLALRLGLWCRLAFRVGLLLGLFLLERLGVFVLLLGVCLLLVLRLLFRGLDRLLGLVLGSGLLIRLPDGVLGRVLRIGGLERRIGF
jgi:hypothetical protein